MRKITLAAAITVAAVVPSKAEARSGCRTHACKVRVCKSASCKARVRRKHARRMAPAVASWYGPGLYGNHLACGGTLEPGTWGVANKSLPCGSRVRLCFSRCVTAPVIDRGPYVGGRTFDLTAPVHQALGSPSVNDTVRWATR